MAFDAKITVAKHLSSVSRAASQRLNVLIEEVLANISRTVAPGESIPWFILPVLEYYFVVCTAADTHLRLRQLDQSRCTGIGEQLYEIIMG